MKIIEVISDTNIGGAGVLLLNRLKNTDFLKYNTVVLIPFRSALKGRLKKIGVRFIEIRCDGDRSFEFVAVLKYIKIFINERPDIVNTHGSVSARIAAWICRVPIKICTRHCVFPVSRHERHLAFLNNMLSDCFIAVADAAKENLISMGIKKNKIKVIINGACALKKSNKDEINRKKERLNIKSDTAVIGFCARLEQCKGHEWFLQAASQLARKNIDFKVLFIGEGSQRNRLEELCARYNLNSYVVFFGFVDDVSPLMNIVDINVNCSIGTETSSLALSEGMSLGIPAVVSDYGGNPYMVKHGINGFVCHCNDSEKMAEYIVTLINDKQLYERMSRASWERFNSELNADAMTKKTNCLYDKLYEGLSQRRKSKT